MVKQVLPSRRVETVIVTNDRPVSVYLCPMCLRPSSRKALILRHLELKHQVPPAELAAVSADLITVPGATGYPDTNLKGKFEKAAEALETYDFVLLHINGTDILSHDAKREEKARFIEKIDASLGRALEKIDLKKTVVVITSDHRTASDPSYKQYRHTSDPVPVLISGDGVRPGIARKFNEKACRDGFMLKGNDLMEFVLSSAGKS